MIKYALTGNDGSVKQVSLTFKNKQSCLLWRKTTMD